MSKITFHCELLFLVSENFPSCFSRLKFQPEAFSRNASSSSFPKNRFSQRLVNVLNKNIFLMNLFRLWRLWRVIWNSKQECFQKEFWPEKTDGFYKKFATVCSFDKNSDQKSWQITKKCCVSAPPISFSCTLFLLVFNFFRSEFCQGQRWQQNSSRIKVESLAEFRSQKHLFSQIWFCVIGKHISKVILKTLE